MKRFIVVGLMLAFLSGCATMNVVSKPAEEVTKADGVDMGWEWLEIFSTILSVLPGVW